jgi:hypothetical protein
MWIASTNPTAMSMAVGAVAIGSDRRAAVRDPRAGSGGAVVRDPRAGGGGAVAADVERLPYRVAAVTAVAVMGAVFTAGVDMAEYCLPQ